MWRNQEGERGSVKFWFILRFRSSQVCFVFLGCYM